MIRYLLSDVELQTLSTPSGSASWAVAPAGVRLVSCCRHLFFFLPHPKEQSHERATHIFLRSSLGIRYRDTASGKCRLFRHTVPDCVRSRPGEHFSLIERILELTAFTSQMLPNLERMTREYVYQFSPSLWNADLRVARPKTSSELPNSACRMLRTPCLGFERRGSRHYRGSTMNLRGLLRQVPRTFYLTGAPPEGESKKSEAAAQARVQMC